MKNELLFSKLSHHAVMLTVTSFTLHRMQRTTWPPTHVPPISWQDRQNCDCRIYVGYLMSPLSSVTCLMTSHSELDIWGSTWQSCKYTMAHVLTHWQTHGQSKFGEHVKVLWGVLWFMCRTWLPRYIFHYLILLREAFFEVEMFFRPYNLFFLWGSENSIHDCIYISPKTNLPFI